MDEQSDDTKRQVSIWVWSSLKISSKNLSKISTLDRLKPNIFPSGLIEKLLMFRSYTR